LVDTGVFEVDVVKSTGARQYVKPLFAQRLVDMTAPKLDLDGIEQYIPRLLELFTKESGVHFIVTGKNWSVYAARWKKPMRQLITAAPGGTLKEKANAVARALPRAIAKQKSGGYTISAPQSILRFAMSELGDSNKGYVPEVK
jgi:hypothetical protein